MSNATRFQIGSCGVDSGQIMIVDPCYVIDGRFSEQQYDECCAVTCGEESAGQIMNAMAVVSSTGIGDGYYPVYATVDNIPGWGERITKLEIDFTDHILLGHDEEEECQRCGEVLSSAEEEYCWRCEEHLEGKEQED